MVLGAASALEGDRGSSHANVARRGGLLGVLQVRCPLRFSRPFERAERERAGVSERVNEGRGGGKRERERESIQGVQCCATHCSTWS